MQRTQVTSMEMLKQLCARTDIGMIDVFIQHGDGKQEFFSIAHSVIEGLLWDSWNVFPNADNSHRCYTSDAGFMMKETRILGAISRGRLFIHGDANVTCDRVENKDPKPECAQVGV